MRIIKTSVVIALSLLILSSCSFCHTSETTAQDERITVEFSGLQAESICCSWGQVSLSTTTVKTEIMVQNPHLHHLPLKVQCNIYLNDIEIVSGLGDDLKILPQASGSSVRFSSTLDNEKIIDWWVSHINNGEKTRVRIEGKVILSLDEVDMFYPYSEESEFETNMLEGLNRTNLGHIDLVLVKIGWKRLKSEWGKVTSQETEIEHTITINNFGFLPCLLGVTDVDYGLVMNEVQMAKGTMGLPLVLWPGEERSTTCSTRINNRKIIDWWVSHIDNGEKTKYCFNYVPMIKAFNGKLANWPSKTCGTFETKILPCEK